MDRYILKGQDSNIIGLTKKFVCNIWKNPNELFVQSNICDEKKYGKAPFLQVLSLTVLPLLSLTSSPPFPPLTSSLLHKIVYLKCLLYYYGKELENSWRH